MAISSSSGRLSAGRMTIPKDRVNTVSAAAGGDTTPFSSSPPPMRVERLPSWTPSAANTHLLVRQGSGSNFVFKKAANLVTIARFRAAAAAAAV